MTPVRPQRRAMAGTDIVHSARLVIAMRVAREPLCAE